VRYASSRAKHDLHEAIEPRGSTQSIQVVWTGTFALCRLDALILVNRLSALCSQRRTRSHAAVGVSDVTYTRAQ
jgi:hypothetical protein